MRIPFYQNGDFSYDIDGVARNGPGDAFLMISTRANFKAMQGWVVSGGDSDTYGCEYRPSPS
jgi:hypothetical protein